MLTDHGEADTAGDELPAAHHHRIRRSACPHRHRHLPRGQEQEGQDQVRRGEGERRHGREQEAQRQLGGEDHQREKVKRGRVMRASDFLKVLGNTSEK